MQWSEANTHLKLTDVPQSSGSLTVIGPGLFLPIMLFKSRLYLWELNDMIHLHQLHWQLRLLNWSDIEHIQHNMPDDSVVPFTGNVTVALIQNETSQ